MVSIILSIIVNNIIDMNLNKDVDANANDSTKIKVKRITERHRRVSKMHDIPINNLIHDDIDLYFDDDCQNINDNSDDDGKDDIHSCKLLFDNIEKYDYKSVIQCLQNNFPNCEYLKKKISNNDIMLYYSKCRYISVILFNKLVKGSKYKKYGDVYHIKKINNEKYFMIIEFKNKFNKIEKRNKLYDDKNVIHVSNSYKEAIQLCELYLCDNSILNESIKYDNKYFHDSKYYPQRSSKYIKMVQNYMSKLHPLNRIRFLFIGSIVLYTHNLRMMNDIDAIIIDEVNNIGDIDDIKLPKLHFIDFSKQSQFPTWWSKHLKDIAKKVGAKCIQDIVFNPKYHYYYNGIKIMSLDVDIVKRRLRNRPKACADLIMIKRLLSNYDKKIGVQIVSKITQNRRRYNDEKQFIDTVQYALSTRYRLFLDISSIKEYVKIENGLDRPLFSK